MAVSLIIEQEQGTYVGSRHSHNGYYAGDFSQPRHPAQPRRRIPTVRTSTVFDRLKLLASVEAKAQRDQDFTSLAAIDQVEFGAPVPEPLPPGG